MSQIFKTSEYSLQKLLVDIEYGDIGLPDLQRPFVWTTTQVRNLVDSLYKGYPIGFFLFWESDGNTQKIKQIGTNNKQHKIPKIVIIDGQQRLTALYAVIKGISVKDSNFKEKRIKIAFNPIKEIFEVTTPAIEKTSEWISDISILWSGKSIFSIVREYFDNINGKFELNKEETDNIEKRIMKLVNIQTFKFTALEIGESVNIEEVSDIFVRINSEGKQLNQADFILTLLSVYWDEGRKRIEEFCYNIDRKFNSFDYLTAPSPADIIRVLVSFSFYRGRLEHIYNILRGRDTKTRDYKDDLKIERLNIIKDNLEIVINQTNWNSFFKIILGLGFISNKLINSDNNLFFSYIYFLIGKYKFKLEYYELEKYIGKYFVFIHLSEKYSGSVESTLEKDLKDLEKLNSKDDFFKYLDKEFSSLTEDFWNISIINTLETSSPKNPIYLVYMASLIKNNTYVLFSNNTLRELYNDELNLKKNLIDKHHIFPKTYLSNNYGYDTNKDRSIINQVANITIIGYNDNIKIGNKSPKDYYFEMIDIYGENKVVKGLKDNSIPYNFYNLEYDDFLDKRRKLLAKDIKKYYNCLMEEPIEELHKYSYIDLIKNGESNKIEYKSSLRWDYHQNQINKNLELVIIKTISAFLNSEGGILFIGVKDNGEILGLQNDYETFSEKNKDGFLKHFDNLINNNFGKNFYHNIKVKIEKIDLKDICIIEINKGGEPIFIKINGKDEFYIRASASSQPLSIKEINGYTNQHW